ncbi:MAG TPA: alpha/beta fold hydrolase, partial [Longimicrobiales bacterium]
GLSATMDSPDQGARGIPVGAVTLVGDSLTIEVPVAAGSYVGVVDAAGQVIDGMWRQGGVELALVVKRSEAEEPPQRPQEPTPPLPYVAEDVRYPNAEAGIELAGTLTLPEGEGPFPAVLLISGSGPQDRNETVFDHRPFLVVADHLTRNGIAVLRVDDRGVGESTGVFGVATSEDFTSDALAGVAYLADRPEVDAGAIGLVGHSEGGLVAPMVANRSGSVAFVVLLAGPGVTGEEILYLQGERIALASGGDPATAAANRRLQERMFEVVLSQEPTGAASRLREVMVSALGSMMPEERQALGLSDGNLEAFISRQVAQVNSPWFRYFLVHDPAPELRALRVPILALLGELDLQVPADQNAPALRQALAEGGNPDATVESLPGLNHLFQPATTGAPGEYATIPTTFDPGALDRITAWILRVTGAS